MNHPHDKMPFGVQRFLRTANSDTDRSVLGSEIPDAEGTPSALNASYEDSNNAIIDGEVDGLGFVAKKLHGEIRLIDRSDSDYIELASFRLLGKIIVILADKNGVKNSLITVDGIAMVDSENFPARHDRPFQWDINESCVGGEFVITDNESPPMLFSLKDIIDNHDVTNKYKSEFNLQEYIPNLTISADHPVFDDLVNVGQGGGRPVGQYAYTFRYVNEDGDGSAWCQSTPLIYIPVARGSASSNVWPYQKELGGDANLQVNTSFAPKIRFRINNRFNYSFIQIARIEYNEGAGLLAPASMFIVKTIKITKGQFSIYTFIDSVSNTESAPEIVTDIAEIQNIGLITRAKSVKYHDRRIWYSNVEYRTREIDVASLQFDGFSGSTDHLVPIVHDIGKQGYANPKTHVYKKMFMNGERNGIGIQFFDSFGVKTFATSLPGFENYKWPERRDKCDGNSFVYSENPVKCATNDGDVDFTFEVHDQSVASNKSGTGNTITNPGQLNNSPPLINICNANTGVQGVSGGNISGFYGIYRPKAPSDPNMTGHDIRPNPRVEVRPTSNEDYNPHIWGHSFRSLGGCIKNVKNIPQGIGAFSVVRTKPANRVISQGLGFYSMTPASGSTGTSKSTSKIWVYFPDNQNGIFSSDLMNSIVSQPTSFAIQFVAPYGMTQEIYHKKRRPSNRNTKHIDMLVNCTLQAEFNSKRCNPGDTANDIGISDGSDGYVCFGKWRNPSSDLIGHDYFPNAENKSIIGLTGASLVVDNEEGVQYLEIEVDDDIYLHSNHGGFGNNAFNDADMKKWHEPVYVVNIVQNGANVPDDNVTEYFDTGAYIKVESIIGYSAGLSVQSYDIVDERIEDFHQTPTSGDCFIFVRNAVTLEESVYVNVNEYPLGSVPYNTIIDAITNGTPYGGHSKIHGIYKSTETQVYFFHQDYVAPSGYEIIVKYDTSKPIRFFGGDTYVGYSIFPIIHRSCADGGGERNSSVNTEFHNSAGFPYWSSFMHNGVVIFRSSGTNWGGSSLTETNKDVHPGYIRQMIGIYICQSKSQLALSYGDAYPIVHYVHRPYQWDNSNPRNRIHPQYFDDYPDEELRWTYGGFRINQFPLNLDYSRTLDFELNIGFSKPKVGADEKLRYCSRTVWSLQRDINDSLSPSLKTFLPTHIYDIEDMNGGINFLARLKSQYGENLYAITNKDIAVLLINKSLLSEGSGVEFATIGTVGNATAIAKHEWLNLEHGCPDELWRTIAVRDNSLYFFDRESFFSLREGVSLSDTSSLYSKEITLFLSKIEKGYHSGLCSIVDFRYNNYIVCHNYRRHIIDLTGETSSVNLNTNQYVYKVFEIINLPLFVGISIDRNHNGVVIFNNNSEPLTVIDSHTSSTIATIAAASTIRFVFDGSSWSTSAYALPLSGFESLAFSINKQGFVGKRNYRYLSMVSFERELIGFRNRDTYNLHGGYVLNGSAIEFSLTSLMNPGLLSYKQYVKFRLLSNRRPTKIQFLDEGRNVLCEVVASKMKNKGKNKYFEFYIDREVVSRMRVNGDSIVYRIIDSENSDFVLKSVSISYQTIK